MSEVSSQRSAKARRPDDAIKRNHIFLGEGTQEFAKNGVLVPVPIPKSQNLKTTKSLVSIQRQIRGCLKWIVLVSGWRACAAGLCSVEAIFMWVTVIYSRHDIKAVLH